MTPSATLRTGRWRLAAALLLALALAFVLASCGSDDDGGATTTTAADKASAAFPVTIEHKYGSTTIEAEPKRIVTVGMTDQDTFLALGIKPVGVDDWFGERPYGNWPWTKARWGSFKPTVVGQYDEYKFEKIAALRPDLIVGLYSGMTKGSYAKLSKIAPTIAQPKGHADYSAPWQLMAEISGRAVGREAEARKLVADAEARFAKVRDEHPDFKGKSITITEFYEGEFSTFGADDPRHQFFTQLGFVVDPEIRKLYPGGKTGMLSSEKLDILDGDRLVVLSSPETEKQVAAHKLFHRVPVVRDGRTVYLPYERPKPEGAALVFNTVLSIPYALDAIVPKLADPQAQR